MLNSIFEDDELLFNMTDQETNEDIAFDTTTQEVYSFSSEIPKNTLQDGSIVTDHIINKPLVYKMSGIVSDTPIEWGIFESPTLTRSLTLYKKLEALRERKPLLTLVAGLDVLEDMGISSINIVRDTNRAHGLFADITFEKIKIVELKTKTIEQSKVKKELQSSTATPINKGTVQGAQTENSSFAYKIKSLK